MGFMKIISGNLNAKSNMECVYTYNSIIIFDVLAWTRFQFVINLIEREVDDPFCVFVVLGTKCFAIRLS